MKFGSWLKTVPATGWYFFFWVFFNFFNRNWRTKRVKIRDRIAKEKGLERKSMKGNLANGWSFRLGVLVSAPSCFAIRSQIWNFLVTLRSLLGMRYFQSHSEIQKKIFTLESGLRWRGCHEIYTFFFNIWIFGVC